jgi:hypothetical protein
MKLFCCCACGCAGAGFCGDKYMQVCICLMRFKYIYLSCCEPFTFLSIPYVDNFGLEMNPKHPIERTAVKRYDRQKRYVTEMHLRLRVKLKDGATTVQEIARRDHDWTFSNENGLWPQGKCMEEKHVTDLIALFQAPTGVTLAFPIHGGMQNRLVHATLEPPLSSLRKTEL